VRESGNISSAMEDFRDRGWGKPKQSHEAEITHRYVIEIPTLMDKAILRVSAQKTPHAIA
jgi:hypothetical protein